MTEPATIDDICRELHDAYEAAAAKSGWETQRASRVPWDDVPHANKSTMKAAVTDLLGSKIVLSAADLRPRVAALQARHHAVRRAWSAGTLSPTTYIKSCAYGNDRCPDLPLIDAIAELLPPETETTK